MPAYFTLMMEFSRYEVDLDTVEKLDKAFEIVGLKFKSGFWGKAEDRTKEEIILHNQTLLEEDFMLGAAQNHDEGYWQSEYEYEGFSSVRGMFLNNAPEKGEFEYVLLIPEEEVLGGDGKTYRADPIERLGVLAEKLWAIPQIRSIQKANTARASQCRPIPLRLSPRDIIPSRIQNSMMPSTYSLAEL